MSLEFPNLSRSYDAKKNRIQFWGHDRAKEISFFVEAGALCELDPQTLDMETGYLKTFDAARDRIQETARKAYSRSGQAAYVLAAADF